MEHNENNGVEIGVKKVKRKAPKQVSFRLTEQEFWKLVGNAEQSNANSISDYAKKIVLKDGRRSSLVPKIAKEDSLQMVRELNAIGNNLNQIAKWVNSNDRVPMDKEENFINTLERLRREVNEVWQRLS
ncbi:plasmid mobilization protein [Macrococcoides caseolyticum]|uniref:plasmid mobilization protein n=1 Tax=Macrococcoides caseolyticum TaxID=69966 RepID=UPI00067FF5CF|nr:MULTISPECIES: plasmid mobilization relaxosome protein MobC [Macrococcus]TDM39421.1 plasmid mobilization relaxosome protein MobC [Macrococcus goetzii]